MLPFAGVSEGVPLRCRNIRQSVKFEGAPRTAMAPSAVAAARRALTAVTGRFVHLTPGSPSALCPCWMNSRRTMTSQRDIDHLERTATNFRQEIISPARVSRISNESETVRRVRLDVTNSEFTFKAGQWIDLFIPGVAKVGGFSICSSPGMLKNEGVLELAVKYNVHPPAHWIHTQCKVDSEVALRVGGDFFFDPKPSDPPVNLLLIAGGVGINPLFSILLHVADLLRNPKRQGSNAEVGSVTMFYSAKNTDELLFKKNILDLTNQFPEQIGCSFHVTQQITPVCDELQPYLKGGRISEKDLEKSLNSGNSLCYICGPPPMIEDICKQLEGLGVPKEKIRFEKWW